MKDAKCVDKIICWYGLLIPMQHFLVVTFKPDFFNLYLVMSAIFLTTLLIVLIFRIKEKKRKLVKLYIYGFILTILLIIGQCWVKITYDIL